MPDNNIWISYFIRANEQSLINIINKNDLTIFSCDELLEEFERVLNYPHIKKFNVNIFYALKTVKNITTHYELIYPIKRYIPIDEKDDYLIALALQTSSVLLLPVMMTYFQKKLPLKEIQKTNNSYKKGV